MRATIRWAFRITIILVFFGSIFAWIWGLKSSNARLRIDRSISGLEKLTFVSYQHCLVINVDVCWDIDAGRGLSWRTPFVRFFGGLGLDFVGAGFRWRDGRQIRRNFVNAIVPWFPIVGLSGALTARSAWRIYRNRRQLSPTACKSCGYDLRAGHDKCPECGGESHVKLAADANTAAR